MIRKYNDTLLKGIVFGIFGIFVAIQSGNGMTAPEPSQSGVEGWNCAACHEGETVLPDDHPDTAEMNLEECKTCHTEDMIDLTGKLTGSHFHLLADVTCEDCHEEMSEPEETAMETCVACHGSPEELVETTKDTKPTNPHTSPHYGTDLDCNLCHHQHAASEDYCAYCHDYDFKTP
jgi:hypothetical protein